MSMGDPFFASDRIYMAAFLGLPVLRQHVGCSRHIGNLRVCSRRCNVIQPKMSASADEATVERPSGGGGGGVKSALRGRQALERDPELALSEEDGFMVADVEGGDYDLVEKTKKVRLRTAKLLSEMEDTSSEGAGLELASDADSLPPVADDETMPWVRTTIMAADERKARDPVAIRVARVTYMTSFIVALTGRSEPQIKAIANLVEERMHEEHGCEPRRTSGKAASGWILLDYGDMMVHVFLPDEREFYDLESLWKKGEVVDISKFLSGADSDKDDDKDEDDESLDDWIS